jgi:hypothetical protein
MTAKLSGKQSHDPEPILPGIANPMFAYEEQI